ncbi:MAG: SDR family oxidoreductase [Pseudomonadota bacterium]
MRARGGGRIVNITALSVLQPRANFGLSIATWAGVLGYAKTLSLEVAADFITVNSLCPGRIATGRLAKVFGSDGALDDAALAAMAQEIPMRRLARSTRSPVVGFLASPLRRLHHRHGHPGRRRPARQLVVAKRPCGWSGAAWWACAPPRPARRARRRSRAAACGTR